LLTHRVIAMTKSRTIANYWLLALAPDNAILLNPRDAAAQGLKEGDQVRIVSATNPQGVWDIGPSQTKPMVGRVKLTEMIRPGCISFSLGHGHWAMGSSDQVIDGKKIPGDPRRAQGVHANAAMWLDPHLKNTCFLDPIGGSVSFYDTKVRLEKV
jgi:anaerobic selenocysteine-containing dehydrogenase